MKGEGARPPLPVYFLAAASAENKNDVVWLPSRDPNSLRLQWNNKHAVRLCPLINTDSIQFFIYLYLTLSLCTMKPFSCFYFQDLCIHVGGSLIGGIPCGIRDLDWCVIRPSAVWVWVSKSEARHGDQYYPGFRLPQGIIVYHSRVTQYSPMGTVHHKE